MKKLILAALVAVSFVLGGCVSDGDYVGTRADGAFPEGSISNPE